MPALLALSLAVPSTAFAQEDSNPVQDAADTAARGVLTTTIILIAAPLTSILGGVSSTLGLTGSIFGQVDQYIRDNAVALQQDLQVGGGDTVNDLAQMFSIPPEHHAMFGQILRQHRAQLVPLTANLNPDLDRARAFVTIVVEGMAATDELSPLAAQFPL
jgi:hypothetical protein